MTELWLVCLNCVGAGTACLSAKGARHRRAVQYQANILLANAPHPAEARGAAIPFGPLGASLEHATIRKGAVIATAACMHGDRHIPLQLLCAFGELVWLSKCTGE